MNKRGISLVLTFVGVSLLVVSFQNCGGFGNKSTIIDDRSNPFDPPRKVGACGNTPMVHSTPLGLTLNESTTEGVIQLTLTSQDLEGCPDTTFVTELDPVYTTFPWESGSFVDDNMFTVSPGQTITIEYGIQKFTNTQRQDLLLFRTYSISQEGVTSLDDLTATSVTSTTAFDDGSVPTSTPLPDTMKGDFDGYDKKYDELSGWVCSPEEPNKLFYVNIYVDGKIFGGGINTIQRDDVDDICLGGITHGFSFKGKLNGLSEGSHTVEVHAVPFGATDATYKVGTFSIDIK